MNTTNPRIAQHQQPAFLSPQAPTTLFGSYSEILSPIKFRSIGTIVLVAIAGLLEGLAIVTLLPVLQLLRGDGSGTPLIEGPGAILINVMKMFFGETLSGLLLGAVFLFICLGIASAALRLASEAAILWIRTHTEQCMRELMTSGALSMSWAYFTALQLGDLSKAIVEEGFRVGIGVYSFLNGIGAGLIVLVFLALSFAVSVELTSYTLVFGALGVVLYLVLNSRAKRYSKALSTLQGEIGNRASEVFGSLKFYRASGRSDVARADSFRAFAQYSFSFFWSQAYPIIVRFFFEAGAVLFVASFLLINHFFFKKPLESILVFLTLFYRLTPRLLRAQEELMRARVYLPWYATWRERMLLLLSHPDITPIGSKPTFQRSLTLDRVSFRYPRSADRALDDMSLTIKQGECVAIVGQSGGGKTTLLDVILGLVTPSDGDILLDGVSFKSLDIENWRHRIGLVTQENPLFFGSVLENIAWGDPKPDRSRAEFAAVRAHAWEFISSLPDGLDTQVGERGGRLSGGQRQRIAIARALYRDPLLLVLDEATSALDGEAERVVQDSLANLKGSCAMLIVAHRLNTVKFADRIIVLERGAIVEEGTWDSLVARPDGVFRRLAFAQAA